MSLKRSYSYLLLATLVIVLDRLSKAWALQLTHDLVVNDYLSFTLTFNRGINWGILNSQNSPLFIAINIGIAAIIVCLLWYTIHCYRQGHSLIPHTLILAGACSNYFDRIAYGGVIDFIVLSWRSFSWPAFNIADCAIVVGIGLLFIHLWYVDQQTF
jgi:signal peptidase II